MNHADLTRHVTTEVRKALQEALEIDPGEINAEASILDDLGAESIDLLDLRFRLEKALKIRISNQELVEAFSGVESAEVFRRAFTVGAMCAYLVARLEAEGE